MHNSKNYPREWLWQKSFHLFLSLHFLLAYSNASISSPLFFTYSSALSSHFTWCCLLALVVSTLVMYTLSYHSSILSMWSNHHSMVCLTLSLNQHKAFKSPNNAMIIFTQKLIQIISKGLHTPSFFGETISRLVL